MAEKRAEYRIVNRGGYYVPQANDGLGWGDLFWRKARTQREAMDWMDGYRERLKDDVVVFGPVTGGAKWPS